MRLRASEVAAATGGRLVGPDVEVDGASTDTRTLSPGQLFVPLVAARDGHRFIPDALAAGAPACLASDGGTHGGTVVEVADTLAALTLLGAEARGRVPDRVVGITGSVGKTTVKDLAAGALGAALRTHKSAESFNNEIGVPLTLLGAPDGVEALVVEMGARKPGDIAHLARLVRPTVGVITSIGPSHLEFLGDLAGVAREKGALVEALAPDGTAVLHDADCGPDIRCRSAAPVLTFGTDRGDVRGTTVSMDGDLRPTVHLDTPWGAGDVTLSVRGAHQAVNAAAAVAAAVAAGVALDDALAGLAGAGGSHWRMELQRTPSGATVLNDAYNANPLSMAAALRSLAALPARHRLAVVGPMEELGPEGDQAHLDIAALAAALDIELLPVGTDRYGWAAPADHERDRRLAALGPGDAVLVKASRAAHLEALAARLSREAGR